MRAICLVFPRRNAYFSLVVQPGLPFRVVGFCASSWLSHSETRYLRFDMCPYSPHKPRGLALGMRGCLLFVFVCMTRAALSLPEDLAASLQLLKPRVHVLALQLAGLSN
jgi:hypothetical protein